MSISQMRVWLERNKVFFEIFSSSLIAAAAIAVGLASYLVSVSQLRVSEIATEPHFYIETTLYRDAESSSYNESEMRLLNAGAPVHNIVVDVKSFIKVNLFTEEVEPIYVPVVGYYFAQFPSHSPKGLVATFKGSKNNYYASQLYFAKLSPEVMNGRPYFDHTFVHVTSVDYLSPFGDRRKLAFLGREQVDPSVVKPILEKYEKFNPLEIEKLTVNSVLEAVNEQTGSKNATDLSPKFSAMTLMRFPIKYGSWRSQNEKTLQRRTNHQSHQTA
ncbi:hypothetical protein E8Q33_07630 [Methylophaga sp. SB9B]|uniref:hypothetical protein n=1 Tax=Methylophaga sp. SB9B TaxID=2570356 RepID=UPI0010A78A71|nr:hypothetical protein [Methylophaga sp. SB9B]THK41727.1 hypothetical protein E8Q33_07630 [Methylophaga sp. SB9B]